VTLSQSYGKGEKKGGTPGEESVMRVLLIDDEPALLEVTRIYLEKNAGMQVTAVRTIREAQSLLEKEEFAVVVTDHVLAEQVAAKASLSLVSPVATDKPSPSPACRGCFPAHPRTQRSPGRWRSNRT
jgi:hypothetical protein